MNTLITIGILCFVGLIVYCLPYVGAFIESFINWHFGGK
jgi:hypothetical protein